MPDVLGDFCIFFILPMGENVFAIVKSTPNKLCFANCKIAAGYRLLFRQNKLFLRLGIYYQAGCCCQAGSSLQLQNNLCIYKLNDKTQQVLKHMRCKILFYHNDNTSDRKKNQSENTTLVFANLKSRKSAPQVESMKGFENDLTNMIQSIQFRKYLVNFY